MKADRILIIGAGGQIGTELVDSLNATYGVDQIIISDIRPSIVAKPNAFEQLDVTDKSRLKEVVDKHGIVQIYQLAAMLSATAEKKPELAWDLNMTGVFNVLNLAKEGHVKKVFWPSSIAVFGPSTPPDQVAQNTVTEPSTVYGISKLAGERWCEYYHNKYGVDVRGIRYPGLIGFKGQPGGGTTDYAVDIFYQALENGKYTSFLAKETQLPMMYMEDAINATTQLMDAPAEKLTTWSGYNVDSLNFTPSALAEAIKKHIPQFSINYAPDYRQAIADSWPNSIDGRVAHGDWGWTNNTSLEELVTKMLRGIQEKGGLKVTL